METPRDVMATVALLVHGAGAAVNAVFVVRVRTRPLR
jgi:hypothetical protein